MKNDVNIVVGRFQSPTLTNDQKKLLEYSISTSSTKPTVILGLSPLKCTSVNPFDYESRCSMIEHEYPGQFNFKYIKDQNSDEVWSEKFDDIINSSIDTHKDSNIHILGSRDGFYDHYTGDFKNNFEEFSQVSYSSNHIQTKVYSQKVKNTPEWRAGVAYALQSQYPSVYPTVDCAIFNDETFKQLYLARKTDEKLYRFVGGFTSPTDNSYEDAALREAREETNLNCKIKSYVGSYKIDDFRYRNEQSKIITHLYVLVKLNGRAKPCDDINELRLFDVDSLSEDMIQEEHRILFKQLKEHLKTIYA